jgi:hypothetical protein
MLTAPDRAVQFALRRVEAAEQSDEWNLCHRGEAAEESHSVRALFTPRWVVDAIAPALGDCRLASAVGGSADVFDQFDADDRIIKRLTDAWSEYPNQEFGHAYDEVLLEVQAAAKLSGSIGKSDIGALMLWKRLNLNSKWARTLNDLPDTRVREVTRAAIAKARDPSRVIPEAAGSARIDLLDLPGCRTGAAVASTILTAGAPDRMAVYDRWAVDALVDLGFPNPAGDYSRYMGCVCSLLDKVNKADVMAWRPRDVDKALYELGRSGSAKTGRLPAT